MKIQTRIKRYAWLALGVAALLPVSCIKDDYAAKKNASVTLTFTTRAVATDASAAGELEDNEQMRTLRVIVARTNNEILFNNVYDIEPEETSKTINYSELTIDENGENINFYVIANEEGFVEDNESLNNITSDQLPNLKDRILTNDFNVNPSVMIPQTAFKTLRVGPNEDQTATIYLDFVVAKVYVGFINETGEAQTISDLMLLGANPEQGYLFDPGDANRIPNNPTYADLEIAGSVEVAADANADTPGVYAYLYPGNNTEENAYVLQGTWKDGIHYVNDQTITSQQGVVNSLQRGQQLNIMVTLNNLAVETEVKIAYKVVDWGAATIVVPPFN